ncbi:vitamin K-dependent protein C [Phoenicopterus ruber ruber]
MWKLITVGVLLAACSSRVCNTSIFYSNKDANQVLKIQKRANSFLEELKPGAVERECIEEQCDFEEASEIFETKEATLDFWSKYVDGDQCDPQPCSNGICKDNIGKYSCICNKGWEGVLCNYEVKYTNCSVNNGGCEHFCREDPANQCRSCSCASGYQLMNDHTTCKPVVEFPCGRVKMDYIEAKAGFNIRLIEGKVGRRGDNPWQIMLQNSKGRFLCGGVLIHPSWVLTAAHCTEAEAGLKVRLGKFHRIRTEANEQTVWVDKCVSHENYTKETSDNDIAMLHLAEPVMYNKYMLPICLPSRDLAEQELTRSGKQMVVTGWGSTSDVNNNYSTFLSYIEIPIVPRNECARAMRFAISDNMLCAGSLGDKKDSCSGDSGGPMITKYKDTWFLVGLVSWGEGCGQKEKFGVYTKVSQYLEWIQHHIEKITLTKMESSSSLVMLLLLMCSINSSGPFSYSVFMRKDEAHKVLKVHKRANYFLEEVRPGNLERECNEEKCSFEEAKEIFHSHEKTMEFWFNYKGLNPCNTNPCHNSGVCKIRHYNYFCICPPKFGGDNCEKEKFECWYKNGGCWQYCRDSRSAFHVVCSCAEGYTLHEDGKRCVQAAPFPCGLVKARQALEEGQLGQKRLPRALPEHGDEVAKWNESTEGRVRQTELEQSAVGENEAVKDAFGQSVRAEGAAGQTEVAGGASSGNQTLGGCVTQKPLGDGATVPELDGAAEGTPRPGEPGSEPTQGPAWPDETAAPAARQKETAENAAGQNRTGEGAGQNKPGAVPTVHGGLDRGSDWGNASDAPRLVQMNVSATLEHIDSRITGGTLCHRGHCPWQVLIRNSKGIGFCGGSLISSRWVVTAAHCLDLVRPHHVTVGDFDKYRREFKEQKIAVERSWTHPHYDSNDYNGDIALLYLSSDVIFNEYVIPICLPSPSLATLLSEEGRIGMVSGWGATHERGSMLRFLMKVRLPIVSMETCQRSTDRLVTDNMFCAGYDTEVADACKGDSGGPFTVSYHNTWFLLGIVSWGEGCAEKGKYGVYTRVANYIPWIKETVESVADSEHFSINFP